MTLMELISRVEGKLRPFITKLPPSAVVRLYSGVRKHFLSQLEKDLPEKPIEVPEEHNVRLWDIDFGCNLLNAAGMFKNGNGYNVAAYQGAGAYLAGTTTAVPREGNKKDGILHPFSPYPGSGAALNWMGLPNMGHAAVAKKLSSVPHLKKCPVGASLGVAPEQEGKTAMAGLLEGMQLYEKAAVEFLEINESCPNVPHNDDRDETTGLDKNLIDRLGYISKHYLIERKHHLPVVVKFSNDLDIEKLPQLMDILIDMKFDGVNFGNTSTEYELMEEGIIEPEIKSYKYFHRKYGGGLSGKPLRKKSLELASAAVEYLSRIDPDHEFHVIRTGGISTAKDLKESFDAGISLNQWFTGYFDVFSEYGHRLYVKLYDELKSLQSK